MSCKLLGKLHWPFVVGYVVGLMSTVCLIWLTFQFGIGTSYDPLLLILLILGPCALLATFIGQVVEGFEEREDERLFGTRRPTSAGENQALPQI